MHFLSTVKMSLTELVSNEQEYYDYVKLQITVRAQSTKICELLDKCRDIIIGGKPGTNILRYLLHKMNNRVIKWQIWNEQCGGLSNLYLNYGCIPFDQMPYCTSLRQHNPRIYDLFESIPVGGHEHELFARYIKNNTEIEGQLFTLLHASGEETVLAFFYIILDELYKLGTVAGIDIRSYANATLDNFKFNIDKE
ncbi:MULTISPECIES: hypothetical protein [Eisenbergiella]|uniref:hypothetical protein n=1 Tax=Eisenbergiella TaxID=1432051 RepID=UPI001F41EE0D|nr:MULTISPECIES: hypothetical protein [Eisenbergiella]MDY2651820.1 hypothetical protein [Eisenbergiella porci]